MEDFINKLKRNGIFATVAVIIIGILLILFPVIVTKIASYILGAVILGFGVKKIAGYFEKNRVKRVTVFGLVAGIAGAIAGVYVIANPRVISNFTVSIFGIIILVYGLTELSKAIRLKKSGIKKWWNTLLTALIGCGAGIAFIAHPSLSYDLIIRLIGVLLIILAVFHMWALRGIIKESNADDVNRVVINSKGEIEGEGREIRTEDID